MGALEIGPFQLLRTIGRGGMGVVWLGRHREQHHPVAVKVLTAAYAGEPAFVAMFEAEARSVASLDHPNVVVVLDYGRVPVEASAQDLPAGSPYLVMELAAGGTLATRSGEVPWREARAILVDLLGALAHAHARGVLHLDLKAANVLVDATGTRTALTDFGLAHLGMALSGVGPGPVDGASSTRSGTPSHMAPEQFHGQWRDFGPWTDLYAFGALAWTLLTGQPPYGKVRSWAAAARAHLLTPLPPLASAVPVPEGVHGWLARLLAKDPGDRFGRAADAARALLELPDEVGDAGRPQRARLSEAATVVRTAPPAAPSMQPLPAIVAGARGAGGDAGSWRAGSGAPRRWLAGTGLGLFGLRAIPVVDRADLRDALWAAAADVAARRRARLVLLAGAAGCGKSRLAEWLGQELHARGAAETLRAVHAPTPGGQDGLGPMLLRWLRAGQCSRGEVVARATAALGRLGASEAEGHAAAELACPARADEPTTVRFAGPNERHQALHGVLRRVGVGTGRTPSCGSTTSSGARTRCASPRSRWRRRPRPRCCWSSPPGTRRSPSARSRRSSSRRCSATPRPRASRSRPSPSATAEP